MSPWILNGWIIDFNNFIQNSFTCSLQLCSYFIPCVLCADYCCTFTCGRAMGSLSSEVVAQIVLSKIFQFLTLFTFDFIRVMYRLILVICWIYFFNLDVEFFCLSLNFLLLKDALDTYLGRWFSVKCFGFFVTVCNPLHLHIVRNSDDPMWWAPSWYPK